MGFLNQIGQSNESKLLTYILNQLQRLIQVTNGLLTTMLATQSQVNAGTSTNTVVTPATLASKALLSGVYNTVLSFFTDQDIYHDATGQSITFTLGSGNINGVGIWLRLNKPTAFTFPGTFEALPSSASCDPTKLNNIFLVYNSNWDGNGLAHVTYNNVLTTAQ